MNNELKDLKQINIYIPNKLSEIKPDAEILINKNEQIITKYLEHHIYTSNISYNDKQKLELIFTKNRKLILDTL
jgi:hypothetical protein